MKRIYLAAPFDWIDKMKAYAAQLRALGFEVTSRWQDEQDRGGGTDLTNEDGSTQIDKRELGIAFGIRDIRNIVACDTLIEFNPGKALVRNTRIAEFGMAFALGKQCIVVGPENPKHKNRIDSVFVLLDEGTIPEDLAKAGIKPVKHFDTWGDFLEIAVLAVGKKNGTSTSA
jgi:nucleoside 2-deoxyribosyltransferase